jgi:Asp-tRNA(Asn)/Glu-tRNA(Gln) amidotransferase A subunit family amidase/ketopantoate reductase
VVAAVNQAGLRIEGPVEQFTVRVPAVLPADLPERLDGPVLLAVKSHHTAAAVPALAGRMAGDGFVVSLQNGLNTSVIADAVGAERVVEAFVNFGADVLEPGVILRGNRGTFVVGEPDGRMTDRVAALAADIADARATDSVLGYLWAKQAYGTMLFATAVSDLPIYAVFEDPAYRDLLLELGREVLAQAPVTPMPFDGFDPADLPGSLARLAEFNRGSAKTHSGVYRDLAVRHRPTEAPAILGPMDGPLIRRVAELVAAIERGERSCRRANLDLLAAYERLERIGRPLNAVVSVLGAPARSATGPLAGQPVAVKDIVAVAGVPTTCGSPASDPEPAPADAPLVARLRAAGAEVFATTQCLEYAAGFAHPQVGDTRNPRNPERTSGGSSGGSAALVAAGVCDLAIGSDTGGSIRIPAAYCGIVGLKPTFGLIPLDGVFPLSPSCDHAGTLTATVAGTAALLPVLAGIDAGPFAAAQFAAPPFAAPPFAAPPFAAQPFAAQPFAAPPFAAPPFAAQPPGRRFTAGVLAGQLTHPSVTPEVYAAVTGALGRLKAGGWELTEISAPWVDDLAAWEEVLTVIVAREAFGVHRDRDTSGYAAGTRSLLDIGASISTAQYEAALALRTELTTVVTASLAGVDVLAGPTVGFVAPQEDPPFGTGEENAEGHFTGPYNLTGQPAISLPVATSGLPAGLQLAGRLDGDADLLRAAAAAEFLIGPPSEVRTPAPAKEG